LGEIRCFNKSVGQFGAGRSSGKNRLGFSAPIGCPQFVSDLLPVTDGLKLGTVGPPPRRWDGSELINLKDAHRAYNWFDEWGWTKSIRLPFTGNNGWTRYGRVILPVSPVISITNIDAIFHPTEKKVYLYASRVISGGSDGIDLYISEQNNFTNFTRYGKVIAKGASSPDNVEAAVPKVLYDEYEPDPAYRWKMWYHAKDATTYRCCRAHSADGLTWIKDGAVTDPNYYRYSICVIRVGKKYFGYATQNDFDIHLRLSDDGGMTWAYQQKVIPRGVLGEWDASNVYYPSDFWFMGTHYLLYTGYDSTIPEMAIGMALSNDGIHGTDGLTNYWKWLNNPVVRNPFDLPNKFLYNACIIPYEGSFKMYVAERQAGIDATALYTLP